MTPRPDLPDADVRRRATGELDRSFVVTGGRGTGTTAVVVDRVVALTRHGETPEHIVVVVATPTAAESFRRRLAQATNGPADVRVLTVPELALWIVGQAPGGVRVLHPASALAARRGDVARMVDDLLDDPSLEPWVLRALTLGLDPDTLEEAVRRLNTQWDALSHAPGPGGAGVPALSPVDVGPVMAALNEAVALSEGCTDEDDLLLGHLNNRLVEARRRLSDAQDDNEVLSLLARLPSFSSPFGRKENWQGQSAMARAACAAAEIARQTVLADIRAPILVTLLAVVSRATLDGAARRLAAGRVSDDDVLAQARRLLRDDGAVRAAVRHGLGHLLVDDLAGTGADERRLVDLVIDAAADTVVVRVRPEPDSAKGCDAYLPLVANLRSVPGLVAFAGVATALFDDAASGAGAAPLGVAVRSAHASAVRAGAGVQLALPGLDGSSHAPLLELPPVVALGGAIEGPRGLVFAAAARDVASAVARARAEGWPVTDAALDGATRPARWRDVVIAVADDRAVAPLEEALDDAGIPYRLGDPAMLWASEMVGDVLAALAAADDPNDTVSVLTALRSPGLGCGDDDLLSWRVAGGTWDPLAPMPEDGEDHPVGRAMAELADLHARSRWAGTAELVRRTLSSLHALELAMARPGTAGHWHRLEWLVERACRFDGAGGGTLRQFVRWAEDERRGPSTLRSTMLDDGAAAVAVDDAVLVTSLEAVAQLEAPIVVVTGLDGDAGRAPPPLVWTDDGPEVHLGGVLRSPGYAEVIESARTDVDHQRRRAAWTAMTRARDHVVVCIHHRGRDGTTEPTTAARLAEICRAHPLLWRRLPEAGAAFFRDASAAPPGPPVATAAAAPGASATPAGSAASSWSDEVADWEAAHAARRQRLETLPVFVGEEVAVPHLRGELASWAAGRRLHRAVPVSWAVADPGAKAPILFETTVTLIDDDDGLVIIGSATGGDGADGREGLVDDMAVLALQAEALEATTGRPVHRCVLVGADRLGGTMRELSGDDLAEARRAARRDLVRRF